MHFQVIKDEFFERIVEELKSYVPEFTSVFDEPDEVYLVLGEFGRFMIQHSNERSVIERCFDFINDAFDRGSHETKDAIAIQIFEQLCDGDVLRDLTRKYLRENALEIYKRQCPNG